MARISSQKSDDFYVSRSEEVIYNNGDIEDVKRAVMTLMAKLGGDV